jgi:hypothetical protein
MAGEAQGAVWSELQKLRDQETYGLLKRANQTVFHL